MKKIKFKRGGVVVPPFFIKKFLLTSLENLLVKVKKAGAAPSKWCKKYLVVDEYGFPIATKLLIANRHPSKILSTCIFF